MSKFTNIRWIEDLHLVRYRDSREDRMFHLAASYTVLYERDGIDETYTVPRNFATDLSSVPRAARWFADAISSIEPSVVHDAKIRFEDNRDDGDALFLALMMAIAREQKSGWKRTQLIARYKVMHAVVRAYSLSLKAKFW